MSVAEWWLILWNELNSEQAASGSVSFSPQDSWCQVRSCSHYQVCNAAPVVLFICSWYCQTPLTGQARALRNVLRSSEVWGNERKRKRLHMLKQKELGRKEEGVMTVRYFAIYLSTTIKSNPQPPFPVAFGVLFFSGVYKQYNQFMYIHNIVCENFHYWWMMNIFSRY